MPKGEVYPVKEKQIFFRVVAFVEKEREDPIISLHNTTASLLAMLDIREGSIFRLKKKIAGHRQKEQNEQEKQLIRFGRRTTSNKESVCIHSNRLWSTTSCNTLSFVPAPLPSNEKGNSGRAAIYLGELVKNIIQYHFHLPPVSNQVFAYYQQLISLFLVTKKYILHL